ncbi:MAG: type II secretion system F family protein [Gaiellaceae bacterium]|jgi:tight adherence protein B
MTRTKIALLIALGALAFPPGAGSSVEIRGLDASAYPTVRLTAVSSRPVSVTPALAENGQPVVGLQAQNLGQAKAVELVLDRSQSMAGRSLADALAAARTFVGLKAADDRLGLIAFGSSADELAALSGTSTDLSSELGSMQVDSKSGTALYAAVVQAAHALRADPLAGRVIILLTDGRNVASERTLADAISAARAAQAVVYAVGIEGSQFDPQPLQALAQATGGHYVLASSSARLSAIYSGIASELSRSWRLSYVSAGAPGETVTLQASLVGAGSASTRVKLGRAGSTNAARSVLPSFAFTTTGTILFGLLIGLLGLAALASVASARKGSWVQARLAPHVGQATKKKTVGTRERLSAVAALFRMTENVLGSLNVWKRLTRMLERADVPLRTVELVWAMLGLGLGLGLFVSLTGAGSLAVLIAMIVGVFLPYGFVWFKMKHRLDAFEAQLPDLLVTMAASLKAGHSFKAGLQAAMEEGQEPASGEFRRVLTQTSLGRPMDEALKEMSDRLGSANFEFVITAVTIQRQVGGSLAQLFDMVADTVRQRQQFARKVRSLTAMGKMSAYVLVALPFFLAAMLSLINPSYMAPLYHTSTGNMLLALGVGSIIVGSLMLKKIVSFKG